MFLFDYFGEFFPEANSYLRNDSQYIFIFVDDQVLPVGYLTSNAGIEAYALFAFDSLHRYDGAQCLYAGLFHCHLDATQWFLDTYKQQPIYKSAESLGITGIIKGR